MDYGSEGEDVNRTVLTHLRAGHTVESDTQGWETWNVKEDASDDELVSFYADDVETIFNCMRCGGPTLIDDREPS